MELTVPGPTNVSLEDAGDRVLAGIPPQGAVGSPGLPPAPGRAPASSSVRPMGLDAEQGLGTAVGLTGTWCFLSWMYVPVRL